MNRGRSLVNQRFPGSRSRGDRGSSPNENSRRRSVDSSDGHSTSSRGFRRGGQRGRGGGGQPRYRRGLELDLMKFANGDANDIVIQLLDPGFGFLHLLEEPAREIEPHLLPNILRVLAKVIQDDTSPELIKRLLQKVVHSPFFKEKMQKFVAQNFILIDQCIRPSDVCEQFLEDLFNVIKELFIRLENYAYDNLYHLVCVIESTFRSMQTRSNMPCITPKVIDSFEQLIALKTSIITRQMANLAIDKRRHESNLAVSIDTRKPPDDFRQISIVPTVDDLKGIHSKDVFLRKNIRQGCYADVDDYLDVQFRLMREDFLSPLRDGIQEFLLQTGGPRKRITTIRVYTDITICHSLPSDKGIVRFLHCNDPRFKRIRWENSKRLIYGNILCLSSDHFNTVYFAIVTDRKVPDLVKGYFVVKFIGELPKIDEVYVMVESVVYFEAYKHVLEQLQRVTHETLPMSDYLVKCHPKVNPPAYLVRNRILNYDLRVIVDDPEIRKTKERSLQVSPLNEANKWPHIDDLGLDQSQFDALKAALTKELVLIQGPPGTGKTYIGLKIVKILVECVQSFINNFGPIMVVCYTNHALDQFLEGMEDFLPPGSIVRVGSRSKSEILEKYSLSTLRREMIKDRRVPMEVFLNKRNILSEMKGVEFKLLDVQAEIQKSMNTIPNFRVLADIMPEGIRNDLRDRHNINDDNLIKCWLLDEVDVTPYEVEIEDIVDLITLEHIDTELCVLYFEILNEIDLGYSEIAVEDETMFEINRRTIDDDRSNLNVIQQQFQVMLRAHESNYDDNVEPKDSSGWTQPLKQRRKLIRKRLHNKVSMTKEEANAVDSPWDLVIEDRWKLFHYWMEIHIRRLHNISKKCEEDYEQLCAQKLELQHLEDMSIMRKAKIIGFTTTGAARYGRILAQLKCKIVVVEEAAEVMESHIVATLSDGCQHLILIGDHQQLKPSAAVYRLAKDFNLDISLFERLLHNRLQYNVLSLQHRMRPEIAEIMCYIYPELRNHSSVEKYPNIQGVGTNLFFFDHTELEKYAEDTMSYSNPYEAQFAAKLCRHFMLNGYMPSQITILTLYSGQLFYLKACMPYHIFKGVRVCVVDNFQGEESDIIILSLVRSNESEKIGFLDVENRVCVALSRAKMGFFAFGNFQLLAHKSKLWHDIVCHLLRKNQLGNCLQLRCQIHSEKPAIQIKQPDDFNQAPEGGCDEVCGKRLPCGHACPKACHPVDPDHMTNVCQKKCERKCPNEHPCPRKCFQTCEDCQVPMRKKMTRCGHMQMVPCSKPESNFVCQEPCTKLLDCRHYCDQKCGQPCSVKCQTKVRRTMPFCGHKIQMPCGEKPDTYKCTEKCKQPLGCEHTCKRNCGECFNGRLHDSCTDKCSRVNICGHKCKEPCSKSCPPCSQHCEDRCVHNKCPEKCGEPCIPCNESCPWQCAHQKCSKTCSEMCDRGPCDEPCPKMVYCNTCKLKRPCIGVCGEICPKVCIICDSQFLQDIMDTYASTVDYLLDARFIKLQNCRHIFEVTSLDQWMAMDPEKNEIVKKLCPQCKSPILRGSCFRYLNRVKTIIKDIQDIQKKYVKNATALLAKSCDLAMKYQRNKGKLISLSQVFEINSLNTLAKAAANALEAIKKQIEASKVLSFQNSLAIIKKIYIMYSKEPTLFLKPLSCNIQKHTFYSIQNMLLWVSPYCRRFNDFEVKMASEELQRIAHLIDFLRSIKIANVKYVDQWKMEAMKLTEYKSYPEAYQQNTKVALQRLNKLENFIPGLGISNEDRLEIVKAMHLGQGHWFKCPNGHPYVITECGGAMEIGHCNECNSSIGGTSHRLLDNNVHFGAMDGSAFPQYSEQNNLLNINPRDLFDI